MDIRRPPQGGAVFCLKITRLPIKTREKLEKIAETWYILGMICMENAETGKDTDGQDGDAAVR